MTAFFHWLHGAGAMTLPLISFAIAFAAAYILCIPWARRDRAKALLAFPVAFGVLFTGAFLLLGFGVVYFVPKVGDWGMGFGTAVVFFFPFILLVFLGIAWLLALGSLPSPPVDPLAPEESTGSALKAGGLALGVLGLIVLISYGKNGSDRAIPAVRPASVDDCNNVFNPNASGNCSSPNPRGDARLAGMIANVNRERKIVNLKNSAGEATGSAPCAEIRKLATDPSTILRDSLPVGDPGHKSPNAIWMVETEIHLGECFRKAGILADWKDFCKTALAENSLAMLLSGYCYCLPELSDSHAAKFAKAKSWWLSQPKGAIATFEAQMPTHEHILVTKNSLECQELQMSRTAGNSP